MKKIYHLMVAGAIMLHITGCDMYDIPESCIEKWELVSITPESDFTFSSGIAGNQSNIQSTLNNTLAEYARLQEYSLYTLANKNSFTAINPNNQGIYEGTYKIFDMVLILYYNNGNTSSMKLMEYGDDKVIIEKDYLPEVKKWQAVLAEMPSISVTKAKIRMVYTVHLENEQP